MVSKMVSVSAKQMRKPISVSKRSDSTNGQFAKLGQNQNRFLHIITTLLIKCVNMRNSDVHLMFERDINHRRN